LSIFLMKATQTLRPPAGLDALLVVIAHPSWTFLFDPVLAGAGLLIAFAYGFHRLLGQTPYPAREGHGISGPADAEPG
jgi:CBS-domain-containing membrane protein